MYNKKISAIAIVLIIVMMFSGCSTIIGTAAESYPLTSPLTQQEVLDYYAESLAYDTVVSRSAEANSNNYVLKEVTDTSKIENLKKTLAETNSYLAMDHYKSTSSSSRYLTDSMYNYVRAMLNDKTLTNPVITNINQALGYYFVDVEYNIKAAPIGTFKPAASLIGISGAFSRNEATGVDSINKAFMLNATDKLNDHFSKNSINKMAEYSDNGLFRIVDFDRNEANDSLEVETNTSNTNTVDNTSETDNINDIANIDEAGTVNDISDSTQDTVTSVPADDISSDNLEVEANETDKAYSARSNGIDMQQFKDIVGYGLTKAYIPNLDLIYNYPTNNSNSNSNSNKDDSLENGNNITDIADNEENNNSTNDTADDSWTINGIGLYPSGGLGLSQFGMNRDELTGTCILRYIYKESLDNPEELTCTNIYITHFNIQSGFSANTNSLIPEFLNDEFSQLIERADRAVADCDIAALSNGKIFEDLGMAVLQGYTDEYGRVLRQISTLRRIISRDISNNSYLVEIESYKQEGAKSSDSYPSYKDTVYAVIEQSGSEFIITDWMIMQRQLMTEPDIDPDKSTAKRIVALGLTGDVSEENKEEALKLLNNLYKASTYRVLTGPITLSDGTEIEYGMYDCFNSNPEMLSSTRKEEINSDLRKLLVKYGVSTSAEISGQVTEWIGGASNQIEFTTEELITYQGHSDAVYLNCYYLISSIEDEWVIDEIQILSEETVSGDAVNTIKDRLS